MSSTSGGNTDDTPINRQTQIIGSSDRVVLDVGGTKFVAAASTLTSNSAYFSSLLSDNWYESNSQTEIFLDQIPSTFGILLDFMREGFIKIDDINERVLALAEFLGVERLLLAVKIRWYHNIGRGPVLSLDEEITSEFDQKYGGITKAISAGLFPHFVKQDDINADKDYAVLITSYDPIGERAQIIIPTTSVKLVGEQAPEKKARGLAGALNGLHMKGYTFHEKQLDRFSNSRERFTFSRRRHFALRSEATGILVSNENNDDQRGSGYMKQFASYMMNGENGHDCVMVPVEFIEDESDPDRSNPFYGESIAPCGTWLEDNGFIYREEEYEDLFHNYFNSSDCNRIFSRMVVRDNWDQSDR